VLFTFILPSIKTIGFNSLIIENKLLKSIYSDNPYQELQASLEMLSLSTSVLIYQYYGGDC
jgi:hypothetical protein